MSKRYDFSDHLPDHPSMAPLPEEPPAKFYGNHLPPNAPKALQRRPDEIAEELQELTGWMAIPLEHTRTCQHWNNEEGYECTCALEIRIAAWNWMELHNAWRKRAEEAESQVASLSSQLERQKAEQGEAYKQGWIAAMSQANVPEKGQSDTGAHQEEVKK